MLAFWVHFVHYIKRFTILRVNFSLIQRKILREMFAISRCSHYQVFTTSRIYCTYKKRRNMFQLNPISFSGCGHFPDAGSLHVWPLQRGCHRLDLHLSARLLHQRLRPLQVDNLLPSPSLPVGFFSFLPRKPRFVKGMDTVSFASFAAK